MRLGLLRLDGLVVGAYGRQLVGVGLQAELAASRSAELTGSTQWSYVDTLVELQSPTDAAAATAPGDVAAAMWSLSAVESMAVALG